MSVSTDEGAPTLQEQVSTRYGMSLPHVFDDLLNNIRELEHHKVMEAHVAAGCKARLADIVISNIAEIARRKKE